MIKTCVKNPYKQFPLKLNGKIDRLALHYENEMSFLIHNLCRSPRPLFPAVKNLCTQKEGGWHSTLLFRPCHSSKWYWKIYRRVESPFTRRKIINEFKDIENAVYNCVPKIELEILAPIVQICELFTQLENRRIADEIWTCGRHIGLDPASPPKKKKNEKSMNNDTCQKSLE